MNASEAWVKDARPLGQRGGWGEGGGGGGGGRLLWANGPAIFPSRLSAFKNVLRTNFNYSLSGSVCVLAS